MPKSKLISLAEAAQRTGIRHITLRIWCEPGGKLHGKAQKIGRNWVIDERHLVGLTKAPSGRKVKTP